MCILQYIICNILRIAYYYCFATDKCKLKEGKMSNIKEMCKKHQKDIRVFLQELISIESYTGTEEALAKCIKKKMHELGYDHVIETEYGDIVGVLGDGEKTILFDSHMDTVVVNDAKQWMYPPFAGEIADGKIYGRGASDMKSGIAASVYAGFFAKELNLLQGKTVYISTSVMEEDFDKFALANIIDTLPKKLNAVVICEPTDRQIALGHRGRSMIEIHTTGISSHGSAPENGVNAIYEMAQIIKRVEDLNTALYEKPLPHGSVVLSKIESNTVSLNAVPAGCTIYLDRRLVEAETLDMISKEVEELIAGTKATWNIYNALGTSYTGKSFSMHSFMEAWSMKPTDPITIAMQNSFKNTTGDEPTLFQWNFSTNGFASTALNIPTIGYGPGFMKDCHMRDECCAIQDVYDASEVYTHFIDIFN